MIGFSSSQIPINNCSELSNIASNLVGNYYLNVSLSCGTISPIGSHNTNPFSGTFDGKGNSLTFRIISDGNHYNALFRHCKNSILKNITLDNSNLTISGGLYAFGLLCGSIETSEVSYINLKNSKLENLSAGGNLLYIGLIGKKKKN